MNTTALGDEHFRALKSRRREGTVISVRCQFAIKEP
jgi:hypothetical protein